MSHFCVHCGEPIALEDRFCGICGKPNKQTQVSAMDPPPDKTRPASAPSAAPPPPPPMTAPPPAAAQSSGAGGTWCLAVPESDGNWSRKPVERELRIGRHQECELRLEDTEVSRFHASLRAIPGGLWLVDRGSTNGTYVNGRAISGTARVGDGDVITVGKTHITVMSPGRGLAQLDQTIARPRSEFSEALHQTPVGRKRRCLSCGATPEPDDLVCGECGRRL